MEMETRTPRTRRGLLVACATLLVAVTLLCSLVLTGVDASSVERVRTQVVFQNATVSYNGTVDDDQNVNRRKAQRVRGLANVTDTNAAVAKAKAKPPAAKPAAVTPVKRKPNKAAARVVVPIVGQCPDLEAPVHGSVSFVDATDLAPRKAKFECALARRMEGDDTVKCLRSGQWQNPAPQCLSVGLRAYPGRTGLTAIGVVSLHDKEVILGLAESAQRTHNAAGFTVKLVGNHRVWLLAENQALESLVASESHDTYIFEKDGTLKHYKNRTVPKAARMKAMEFATDPSVLGGIKNTVARRRDEDSNVVGFSIALGKVFRASLLGWESLPLRKSRSRHAFLLRPEVEENIQEKGCYNANPATGTSGAFKASTPMPKGTTLKSARLVCAAIAREKNHKFFAISGKECTSGNNAYGEFGAAQITNAADSAAQCAISSATAFKLNVSRSDRQHVVGAGAAPGFFHTFELLKPLLPVPELFNGGFEDDQPLTPVLAGSKATGLQSARVTGLSKQLTLSEWNAVAGTNGEIGLATSGSDILGKVAVPEGSNVLYIQNEGSVTQNLIGLRVGKLYTLRFSETFSQSLSAGMTLSIRLGDNFVVYQNPYVSVPLWTRKRVTFRATKMSMQLTFTATSSSVPRTSSGSRPDSAVLLDSISLKLADFASVKIGQVGKDGEGRVATLSLASRPAFLEAFQKVAKQQEAFGSGGVGIRVTEPGVVALVSHNDCAGLVEDKESTIYYNNGTVVKGFSTKTHSGFVSPQHSLVLKAVGEATKYISNSVAFSVRMDVRSGFQVYVLAPSALPLVKDEKYTTYFFSSGIADLGCWAQPETNNVLSIVQAMSGPINKWTCADAARAASHDYFALQSGARGVTCMTGRSDVNDKTDFVYYAAGHSNKCDQLCVSNGRDNCGGEGAANVYRLPVFARVSHHGHASVDEAVALSPAMQQAAQDIFAKPGKAYFSTVSDSAKVAAAAAAAPLPAGFEKIEDTLVDSPKLTWSHALQYHFAGAQTYAITKYVLQAPALTEHHPATPTEWTFEGSRDGLNWVILDRQTSVAFYSGQKRWFILRNSQEFHFHRLVVTANGGVGAPGFGLQGIELYANRDKVRFLKALYRFESTGSANLGWDSSYKNNDLKVFGGVNLDTNGLSVFNQTTKPSEVKVGRGALKIANDAGTFPSYLAINTSLALPSGIPTGDASFGVTFWFRVDSQNDGVKYAKTPEAGVPKQLSIVSWGDSTGDANSNTISLDTDFTAVRNSFGTTDQTGLGAVSASATAKSTPLVDAWHHYAVSFDQVSGAHRVWLDGTLVASRIYQNPQFSVTPELFLIGARDLPSMDGSRKVVTDEFNGLLDDVAIFNGPLTSKVVREVAAGSFHSYLPLHCQGMSDEFGIEAGITWGRAPDAVKERYLRKSCYTKPTTCQTLSDQYAMSPKSSGKAGYYAKKQYARAKCATWPSVLTKKNTFATCPAANLAIKLNVFTREAALHACNAAGTACQAYLWGGKAGNAEQGLKPYQLNLCSTYLSDLSFSKGTHITTRVSKYLLHPDSKLRCDVRGLPTHENVPTSIHARWLCDSTPGCVGYVWNGLVGAHSKGRAPTPGRTTLCTEMKKHSVFTYPGSGFEVGYKLGAYVVMSDRFAECSSVSVLGVMSNITSSLQARRACDMFDGTEDTPRCKSYAWYQDQQEARLCSSVPQSPVEYYGQIETGVLSPESCQEISNSFGVEYGHSWGFAPFEIKSLFHARQCRTRPADCQQMSNQFKLRPNVTAEVAAKVPGEIRDLWLRSHCKTTPEIKHSQYLVQASYVDLQAQIDAMKAKIDALNVKLESAKDAVITPSERQLIIDELNTAKQLVQHQLDDTVLQQQIALQPILERAANDKSTLDETKAIHNILSGLVAESLASPKK